MQWLLDFSAKFKGQALEISLLTKFSKFLLLTFRNPKYRPKLKIGYYKMASLPATDGSNSGQGTKKAFNLTSMFDKAVNILLEHGNTSNQDDKLPAKDTSVSPSNAAYDLYVSTIYKQGQRHGRLFAKVCQKPPSMDEYTSVPVASSKAPNKLNTSTNNPPSNRKAKNSSSRATSYTYDSDNIYSNKHDRVSYRRPKENENAATGVSDGKNSNLINNNVNQAVDKNKEMHPVSTSSTLSVANKTSRDRIDPAFHSASDWNSNGEVSMSSTDHHAHYDGNNSLATELHKRNHVSAPISTEVPSSRSMYGRTTSRNVLLADYILDARNINNNNNNNNVNNFNNSSSGSIHSNNSSSGNNMPSNTMYRQIAMKNNFNSVQHRTCVNSYSDLSPQVLSSNPNGNTGYPNQYSYDPSAPFYKKFMVTNGGAIINPSDGSIMKGVKIYKLDKNKGSSGFIIECQVDLLYLILMSSNVLPSR